PGSSLPPHRKRAFRDARRIVRAYPPSSSSFKLRYDHVPNRQPPGVLGGIRLRRASFESCWQSDKALANSASRLCGRSTGGDASAVGSPTRGSAPSDARIVFPPGPGAGAARLSLPHLSRDRPAPSEDADFLGNVLAQFRNDRRPYPRPLLGLRVAPHTW